MTVCVMQMGNNTGACVRPALFLYCPAVLVNVSLNDVHFVQYKNDK